MKMTALATPFVCLSLAACSPQQGATIVDQVQTTTASVCAFVPTANTILNLLQVTGPAVTAGQIAEIVCAAVAKQGATKWNYHGVVIDGRFVR